ncbi:MAG: molybdopterin-dependent oxidoreductase [Myxococcota bacterium]
MPPDLTRREFVQGATAGVVLLGLSHLKASAQALGGAPGAAGGAAPIYGDWRDVYRSRFRWERVVRGSHTNTNCVSSCAWNLYVRDGIVWREEQAASYDDTPRATPDFNPRGCNKGACASALMLGPSRLKHPMRRVGPRGSGRWRRVPWDEALEEIAGTLVDELSGRGGEGVICELGPNVDFGPNTAAALRLFRQLGVPLTDSMAMIGDVAVGGTITLGNAHVDGSSDDWFRSHYLVLWMFNPGTTRIPDAHFLAEARYRGARVVSIAPDLNQSAIHADLWLDVVPGSDAALALSACQVILAEDLLDRAYVAEQTDLPFLVRRDSGRFLRESDLVPGGSDSRFAIWNEENGALAWAPGSEGDSRSQLSEEGLTPALHFSTEVSLASGATVQVETVLDRLRRHLDSEFTPEQGARITGVSAETIRRFAREFASAPSALILSQWGSCKHYHSDLIQRSQILLASLTGNLGRAGGGWRSGAFIALEGFGLLAMQEKLGLGHLALTLLRSKLWPEALPREFASAYVSSTLFHAIHGGLEEAGANPAYGDPLQTRDIRSVLREVVEKGQFPVGPPPSAPPPSVIVSIFGNVLRHARGYPKLRERLFEPARLVVDVNFRMSETGRYADLLLPAAGWYEKIGIKYVASFVPYVTLADRAVAPLGEALPEWEIFWRLAQRIERLARERDLAPVRSWHGDAIDLRRAGRAFSDEGRFGPNDQEAVLEFILGASSTASVTLAELRDKGATRLASLGLPGGMAGIYSDYEPGEPIVPLRNMVEKKQPYPTLTGRQQFYVDHPWFLSLGEALPTHKPSPKAGGDYPFTLTGGHTRWSIHAQWRDERLMLRLQRGEPVVYLNPQDCATRGIADHDRVRVRNDEGEFVARAKPAPAIRPGQAHLFHAWEPYQFLNGVGAQALEPSPIKRTQLVGDYGQLHWDYGHYEPNQVDRDTRVEIERYAEPAAD